MRDAPSPNQVTGILLAGGQSRRMGGGDKCLRSLGGQSILAHIVARVRPQVGALLLNANGDPARFSDFGLPVAADIVPGHAGPLAGVLTGMSWARDNIPGAEWIATFPTDAPFLPEDLVERLAGAVAEGTADLACAASGGRHHPVVGLWPLRLEDDLRQALVGEDMRKIDAWTERHTLAVADFAIEPVDPFFNTNRPEDLAEAERLLSQA